MCEAGHAAAVPKMIQIQAKVQGLHHESRTHAKESGYQKELADEHLGICMRNER